jgi:hypothetical protein
LRDPQVRAWVVLLDNEPAGQYAPMPGQRSPETTTRQQAFIAHLLGRCARVGPPLHQWAEAALADRDVRAIRLIQGVLGLTRTHPREAVLRAATTALTHRLFRYKLLERLHPGAAPMNPQLTTRLRHLRLSGMAEALPLRLEQATAAPLAHLDFLDLLVQDELTRRADRLFARRLKQAGITPRVAGFQTFLSGRFSTFGDTRRQQGRRAH